MESAQTRSEHSRLAHELGKLDPAEEKALAEGRFPAESPRKAIQGALVGAAGVHYVAFQLSLRGYAVGLTAPGTEGVDLLATKTRTGKSVALQVKTSAWAQRGTFFAWRGNQNLARGYRDKQFFLALVSLPKDGEANTPDLFIVPSQDIESLFVGYSKGWFGFSRQDASKYRDWWKYMDQALEQASPD